MFWHNEARPNYGNRCSVVDLIPPTTNGPVPANAILACPTLRRREPAAEEIDMGYPNAKAGTPASRPVVPWNKGAFVET